MKHPHLASLLQLMHCIIELHLPTGFAAVHDQIPSHPAMAMAHHHCGAIQRLQAQLLLFREAYNHAPAGGQIR
jgi:hypothetical protein